MALEKDFLHTPIPVFRASRTRLLLGIGLGLAFAFALYALMYCSREMLRFIWIDPLYKDFVVLSRREVDFYNKLIAFLAVAVGQSLAFTWWLNRPRRKFGRFSRRVEYAIAGLWPLNLIFFWLLTLFVGVIGVGFFWRPYSAFVLYPDCNVYFVLAIVVLFLQPWVGLGRLFGRRAIKWMMVSAVVVSAVSLAMSRIDLLDYEAINRQMQSKSIYQNYRIDWPSVEKTKNPAFWAMDYDVENIIYLVRPKAPVDAVPVVVMVGPADTSDLSVSSPVFRKVGIDSIGAFEFSPGSYRLKINRDIPMSVVNKLKAALAAAGIRRVSYALQPIRYEAGESFRTYDDRFMLTMPLPDYYAFAPEQLVESFSDVHRRFGNRFDIVISPNGFYLPGGESVGRGDLKETFKKLIIIDRRYLFRIHIDEQALFEDYIGVMVGGQQAVDELRREYLLEQYGRDCPENWGEAAALRERYPLRILEIPDGAKRIVRKSDRLRKLFPVNLLE